MCICSGECSAVCYFENVFVFRTNFHLTPQHWSCSQDLQCSLMEGGIGKVCLELTTEQSLFGPDVLGVCYHVFLEGHFQPHEWLSSQSLGENTTLAPGWVSRLVPALLLCTSPSIQRLSIAFSTSDQAAIMCPAQLSCSASKVSVWWCALSTHSTFSHSGTADYSLFLVFTLLPYALCPLPSPSRWHFLLMSLTSYAN